MQVYPVITFDSEKELKDKRIILSFIKKLSRRYGFKYSLSDTDIKSQ